MRDFCSESFAERNNYLVVVDDLSIFEGHWLVGGYALSLSGPLSNESEKTSVVLRSMNGPYPSPSV